MNRLLMTLGAMLLWTAVSLAADRASSIQLIGAVTTNATSAAQFLPTGYKSFYGQVVCTSGACTQTQAIYGTYATADTTNGILLCTLTLSGTTRAQDACPVVTAPFVAYYVITTNTSGTAASGSIVAMY